MKDDAVDASHNVNSIDVLKIATHFRLRGRQIRKSG